MLIETNIIKSAYSVIDKREIRGHLKCVCFDYDADRCELAIVGADAQCMVINKVKVRDGDADFCKKWFSDNTGYYITDACLGKAAFCDFGELDGKLVCNGVILAKLDMSYPNWRAIMPEKSLGYATKYCGFRPDLIKKIDKALGYKNGSTIITTVPRVNTDDEQEFLCAHRWDLHEYKDCDTVVLCMPMRLTFNE